MPDAVPIDDEKPTSGEDQQEAAGDEPFFEDMDFAIQMTKFDLKRLDMAMEFVLHVVPAYGTATDPSWRWLSEDVPPSIDLVRRRALVAAYGLIEREFSPRTEVEREDA